MGNGIKISGIFSFIGMNDAGPAGAAAGGTSAAIGCPDNRLS